MSFVKNEGLLENLSKKTLEYKFLKITSEEEYLKYYDLEKQGKCRIEYYYKQKNARNETEQVYFSPSKQTHRREGQQYQLKKTEDSDAFESGAFNHFKDLSIYRTPIFQEFGSSYNIKGIKDDNGKEENLKDYVFISGFHKKSNDIIVNAKKDQLELCKAPRYKSILDDLHGTTIYAVRINDYGKIEIKKVEFHQRNDKGYIMLNDFSRKEEFEKEKKDFEIKKSNQIDVIINNKDKLDEFLVLDKKSTNVSVCATLTSKSKFNHEEVKNKTEEIIKSANEYAAILEREKKRLENSIPNIKVLDQEITSDNLLANWMIIFKNINDPAGGKRRKTKKSRKNKRAKTYRRRK
jgi:hypothetical protein